MSMILGIGCLVGGIMTVLHNGTGTDLVPLGRTLVIAGAIIIAAVVVSASIVAGSNKR